MARAGVVVLGSVIAAWLFATAAQVGVYFWKFYIVHASVVAPFGLRPTRDDREVEAAILFAHANDSSGLPAVAVGRFWQPHRFNIRYD